jgi:hypothetical protein
MFEAAELRKLVDGATVRTEGEERVVKPRSVSFGIRFAAVWVRQVYPERKLRLHSEPQSH